MTKECTMTVEQVAEKVDGMNLDRLSSALAALKAYEEETTEWTFAQQDAAEENGEDLEEDDAYCAAYDEFCEQLSKCLEDEYKTSTEDMSLMMTILCGDWQKIVEFMKDSRKSDLVIETCESL